jgi:trehalose 6-phosphate synthase
VGAPVVLLSHRGPVSFERADGQRRAVRGTGGLVTALTGIAQNLGDAVWICGVSTEEDAAVAAEHQPEGVRVSLTAEPRLLAGGEADRPALTVRFVAVDPERHRQFYTEIANPLLWFVQHGLYPLASAPVITPQTWSAFEDGYVAVNERFAAVVADAVAGRDDPLVMLHDYHFYLVPELVRRRAPGATISHFVHIPWPEPDGWRVLPPGMRDRLLAGLLGADVVAFHTDRFARNFLYCAEDVLDAPVDWARRRLSWQGRQVAARAYPISVDAVGLTAAADAPAVHEHRAAIRAAHLGDGRQLIVRVDRTDPSKNVVRGFLAFGELLEEHPELQGRVTFLASLMPSRQDVAEYADYLAEIGAAATAVNARYSRRGWQPVDLRLQEDRSFALAAYAEADVLVVNAVNDGMNLVAKEAVLLSERDVVLLLSENAGAHEELAEPALTVHPYDVVQQAAAMYAALRMPAAERRRRRTAAAEIVRGGDVSRWLQRQLDDLAGLR